jgi:hypothetical protein
MTTAGGGKPPARRRAAGSRPHGRTWPAEGAASWEGSMTELLAILTPKEKDQVPHDWPKTPRALQSRLSKLAKPLRRVGIEVAVTGEKESGTRRSLWRVERAPLEPFNPSHPSPTPPDQGKQGEGLGEGLQAPDDDPSPTLRGGTPSDLRKEEAKGAKGPESTLLPVPEEKDVAEEGELVCDVYVASQKVRAAMGKTRPAKPCPDPKRFPDGSVYCSKHAKKMTRPAPPGWPSLDGSRP